MDGARTHCHGEVVLREAFVRDMEIRVFSIAHRTAEVSRGVPLSGKHISIPDDGLPKWFRVNFRH